MGSPRGIGCGALLALNTNLRIGLHRESDAFTGQVYLGHRHPNLLTHLHHLGRILHEAVCQLTDVNQSILVHTDIHKRSEGRHIGHDTRQLHTWLKVFEFLNTLLKSEHLEALARIASGPGQLL